MRCLYYLFILLICSACESAQLRTERAIVDCYNESSENPWNETWRLQAGYQVIPRYLKRLGQLERTNLEDYRLLIKNLKEQRGDFPFDEYYKAVAVPFPEINRPSVMASLILCPVEVLGNNKEALDPVFEQWTQQLQQLEDIGKVDPDKLLDLIDLAGSVHFKKEAFRMPIIIFLHHYLCSRASEEVRNLDDKPLEDYQ
ncbi:MAG: hypothetical protein AAFP19_23410 [Bacteroidota bacterium]